MKLPSLAGALSFAHLAGLARSPKDDEDKDPATSTAPKGEDDEEGKSAEDKNKDGDETKKAEDDDEANRTRRSKKAEDGDDEDDDDPDKDDDEDEMRGKSEAAKARRRERARCAAIFACPEAARNVALAASLAFETAMTRKEAIAVLRNAPRGASALSERMGQVPNPQLGPGAPAGRQGPAAVAASWDAVMKKVRAAT